MQRDRSFHGPALHAQAWGRARCRAGRVRGEKRRHRRPTRRSLTGCARNDVTQFIPLLEAVPPARGKRVRPRLRPDVVVGDRGYDHDKYRRLGWGLGVKPLIPRRGSEHGSGLGTHRWGVERAFAHLHRSRRLRSRR
nr:transposase [Streptomyces europaeiscabiei]